MSYIANESPATATALMAGSRSTLKNLINDAAHNIAHASTVGFQASQPLVNGLPTHAGADLDTVFPMDVRGFRDVTPGIPSHTGNALDVAVMGGYFAVETDNGRAYTQNGQFSIHPENQTLVTLHGNFPVLDEGGGEIPVDGPIYISQSGIVSDEDGNEIARLGVFGFQDDHRGLLEQSMTKIGDNLLVSDAALDVLPNPVVMQYHVNSSNVNVTESLVALHELIEAYQRENQLTHAAYRTDEDVISNLITV